MSQVMRVWLRAGVCRALGMAAVAALLLGSPAFAADKTGSGAASGAKVAIPLELPSQSFSSTPLNYDHKDLDKPDFKERPPFLAPKGVVDISKGKPVTSSAPPVTGKLAMVTDGDKNYAAKSIVTLPAGTQWVQVDLGSVNDIYAIVVWHYHEAQRVYFDVIAQVSDDPEFKKDVTTVFNNDDDNSSGMGVGKDHEYVETYEGRLIDTKGIKGRYVRMYSKGNTSDDLNHYIEVEVFGKPAS